MIYNLAERVNVTGLHENILFYFFERKKKRKKSDLIKSEREREEKPDRSLKKEFLAKNKWL